MLGSPAQRFSLSDVTGAFADGAILFPLLAALSVRSDFSGVALLATAGLAYIAAGIVFRVPMSVQPLKSIAIAAIAIGAHQAEVRWAGALLGVVCLGLAFTDADRFAAKVPRAWIHGLQMALGLILMEQGLKAAGGSGWFHAVAVFALAGLLVVLTARRPLPWLGLVATGGLFYAIFSSPSVSAVKGAVSGSLRPEVVLMLVLPQIVLTLANSVVGTVDVSRRYFGEAAKRVTAVRLLASIGLGNLLAASVSGLPYCHGSGGVTAHVKGGARHWTANLVIGVTLVALAAFRGNRIGFYPPVLLGVLLAATGIFHLQLAAPTWAQVGERWRLAAMGAVAMCTQNMLWVLCVGVVPELAPWTYRRLFVARKS